MYMKAIPRNISDSSQYHQLSCIPAVAILSLPPILDTYRNRLSHSDLYRVASYVSPATLMIKPGLICPYTLDTWYCPCQPSWVPIDIDRATQTWIRLLAMPMPWRPDITLTQSQCKHCFLAWEGESGGNKIKKFQVPELMVNGTEVLTAYLSWDSESTSTDSQLQNALLITSEMRLDLQEYLGVWNPRLARRAVRNQGKGKARLAIIYMQNAHLCMQYRETNMQIVIDQQHILE